MQNQVYHFVEFGKAKSDFRGTLSECIAWMREARLNSDTAYYMRSVRK